MKVLVVIPAYNEEESIRDMVTELRRVAPWADPLVIDDRSRDATLSLCREHGIPVVALPINLGIGGGVQTGYRYAVQNGYDIAVQMDGDGQHDPAMLERLLRPVIEGRADMSIGSRFVGDVSTRGTDIDAESGMGDALAGEAFRSTALRRVGIRFFERWIRLLSGVRITDATSGFRACNRKAMRLFIEDYARDYPEPEAAMTAIRNGLRVVEVPVRMRERQGGVSSIRRLKSAYYMIKVSLAIAISAVNPRLKLLEGVEDEGLVQEEGMSPAERHIVVKGVQTHDDYPSHDSIPADKGERAGA